MTISSAQFYLPNDVEPYGPKVTIKTPSPGALLLQQAVRLRVESEYPITQLQVAAHVDGHKELVYGSGVGFGSGYSATLTAAADSFELSTLRRIDGWRGAVTFTVDAQDSDGGSLHEELVYTGDGSTFKPTIGNFAPSRGTSIDKHTAITFDVLHPAGPTAFRFISISVTFPDGSAESVWQGAGFSPYYLAQSTRSSIEGGYHYVARRRGGWPGTPTFALDAVDSTGQLGEEP